MRTDGQTKGQADMTKLIVAFRNFANGPKKVCRLSLDPSVPRHTRFKNKQDIQCTYNVTLRRVHETIVAEEKQ